MLAHGRRRAQTRLGRDLFHGPAFLRGVQDFAKRIQKTLSGRIATAGLGRARSERGAALSQAVLSVFNAELCPVNASPRWQSTPMCSFMPKYNCWPFLVWRISAPRKYRGFGSAARHSVIDEAPF